nr:MAG TPA: hypothetical protein [Caudoviricetes sp.]
MRFLPHTGLGGAGSSAQPGSAEQEERRQISRPEWPERGAVGNGRVRERGRPGDSTASGLP